MSKRLVLDTETTGVDFTDSYVIQIGMIIEYKNVMETYELFCSPPEPEYKLDQDAVEKHGYGREEIDSFPTTEETYKEFLAILSNHVNKYDKTDKFVVYGYKSEFDEQMMRKFFLNNNDSYFGSWFWNPWVDVMALAMYALREQRHRLENFKQVTVAKYLEINVEESELHGALYDAQLTKEILMAITSSERSVEKKSTQTVVNERLERALNRRQRQPEDEIPF